ncbi:flagellar FliJ family protein [Legionella sp. CNM-4043-24]|uniref:flagellar FliJ family protein n=1 Tax=Legionella sp. CNM-4043-24 TaxID=3421646 RepID=UPI00403B24FD
MSQATRNPAQIELMIKSFSLRKNAVKNQIMQLNATIAKKKQSIETLQNYAASYEKRTDTLLNQSAQIIKNNLAFYQQLAHVIHLEKTELEKLDKIKQDLTANYHELNNRLDAVSSIRDDIGLAMAAAMDKRDDSDLSDLSIVVSAREREWNL